MEQAGALKAKGAQVVACLSVNDVFVTEEWGRAHQAEGKVRCGAVRGWARKEVSLFFITFYLLILCVGWALVPLCTSRSQRIACETEFSPTRWDRGD